MEPKRVGYEPDGLIGGALGGLAAILVAGLLVGVRGDIAASSVALLLALVVVAAGAVGGRAAGAVAALSAALAFNFFHTRPYQSLHIDSADDVETTLLLLLVGLAAGQLASRARRASAKAASGRDELGRIRRLADQVARGDDSADVILAAQAELEHLLDLESCRFEAAPFTTKLDLPMLERNGSVAGRRYFYTRHHELALELPASGVALPVLTRGHTVGRFLLFPKVGGTAPLEQRVVAVAVADQVGGSIAVFPNQESSHG